MAEGCEIKNIDSNHEPFELDYKSIAEVSKALELMSSRYSDVSKQLKKESGKLRRRERYNSIGDGGINQGLNGTEIQSNICRLKADLGALSRNTNKLYAKITEITKKDPKEFEKYRKMIIEIFPLFIGEVSEIKGFPEGIDTTVEYYYSLFKAFNVTRDMIKKTLEADDPGNNIADILKKITNTSFENMNVK